MFYIEWADAHPVEFWLLFWTAIAWAVLIATAVLERGGRNHW